MKGSWETQVGRFQQCDEKSQLQALHPMLVPRRYQLLDESRPNLSFVPDAGCEMLALKLSSLYHQCIQRAVVAEQ